MTGCSWDGWHVHRVQWLLIVRGEARTTSESMWLAVEGSSVRAGEAGLISDSRRHIVSQPMFFVSKTLRWINKNVLFS